MKTAKGTYTSQYFVFGAYGSPVTECCAALEEVQRQTPSRWSSFSVP